jgi:hypothetical protein
MTAKPSIFDSTTLFTEIPVELQFRDRVVGGTPKDPSVIEGWLRSKMGVSDEDEQRYLLVQTLIQLGAELEPKETDMDKIVEASRDIASEKKTQGFKLNGNGLYLEGRQVKACLKESVSCLYTASADKWGKGLKSKTETYKGKAPASFFPEHVFVKEEIVPLGVTAPTGVELSIGHISDPKTGAQRSTLTYFEYVEQATIQFIIQADRMAMAVITADTWRDIWVHAQENGLGAMRSQGYGKFNVTRWDYPNSESIAA